MKPNLKRILAFALAAVLCLGLILPVAAQEVGGIIYIKSGEDLMELAERCRLDTWSVGKTVVLRKDISLDGLDFQPIPSFGGTFKGCGFTISGLALYDSVTPAGLFGTLQPTALVRDLTVTGTVSPSGKAENVGGIVGENYGCLRGCRFTGTIKGKTNVGGIVGYNGITGTVYDCVTSGSMKGEKMTGGIAGCNLGIVTGCENGSFINTVSADKTVSPEDIDLTFVTDLSKLSSLDTGNAASDTGGIAGYSSGIIGDCRNVGTVGYPHVGYNVGGITGRSCGYLHDCENTAPVYGRKDVGGITGQMEPFIAANLTETTLAKLERQLEELDVLLNQALEDTGDGMDGLTNRLNGMAGSVGGAAAGLRDIRTTATIESSASSSGGGEHSGSVTVTPPKVEVDVSTGGGSLEGSISGGLTESGISGAGGSSVGGNVSASTQITMTTSLSGVASSLNALAGQMRGLSGEMAGTTGVLRDDITAIQEKVNEVSDTAYDLFLGEGDKDILIDSSETDIDLITLGKVADCENTGEIAGDINIGGIAGTMALEYELDPEDDLSSQVDASERRKYEVKAVAQRCVNRGSVTAKRSCVGGIAGRMDLGLIAQSENYGYICSESGDYVGGIAGVTSSTVRFSYAKCTLSGGSYIGGIVGSGVSQDLEGGCSNVVSCCSMVEIEKYEQFAGAVSGDKAGTFLDNYFVSDTLAGINGMSYSGQAEPLGYDELLSLFDRKPEPTEATEETEETEAAKTTEETEETEETEPAVEPSTLPDEFRRFSLRFVIDGETVKELTFRYGDSFDASVYPELPRREGFFAFWDLGALEELKFDTVVAAVYSPYTTSLASREKRESGRPVFYAQGEFEGIEELPAARMDAIPADLDVVAEDPLEMLQESFSSGRLYRKVQECWRVTVPEDGLTAHTLRFLPPEGKEKRLTVFLKEDGVWTEVDSEYIGSYLAFEARGNDVQMAVVSTIPVWWVWLLPAALVLTLLALLIRAIRRAHKRRKARREALNAALAEGGMPEEQAALPAPAKRRRRRWPKVLLIVAMLLAIIAGVCAAVLVNKPGIVEGVQAYRLVQASAGKKELAMHLTVDASRGDQSAHIEADMDKIQFSGKDVTVVRQSGGNLYYCQGAVYLENGRGYRLSGDYPDYSQLLEKTGKLLRGMEITGDQGEYTVTVSGEDAAGLLEVLAPSLRISEPGSLEIRLTEENGELKAIRFLSTGDEYTLDAALTLLDSRETVLPQRIQDAITSGSEVTTVLSGDLVALANAWNSLESRELLCADLRLSADCGPLKLSEQLEFYRDNTGEREIFSLQKNGYGLYFTDRAVCDRNGLSVSAERERLADSARLLELAYTLFGEANVSVSGGVYTVTLDEEGMRSAALAIAPETGEMDITYNEGTLQLRLADGEIASIAFQISGSARVVVAEVPVSLTGELIMAGEPREFQVPDAARKVLEK